MLTDALTVHNSVTADLVNKGQRITATSRLADTQSGCPVENRRPELLQWNPDIGGMYGGVKSGLQEAAKKAYMQSKANPQLIMVIVGVSLACQSFDLL